MRDNAPPIVEFWLCTLERRNRLTRLGAYYVGQRDSGGDCTINQQKHQGFALFGEPFEARVICQQPLGSQIARADHLDVMSIDLRLRAAAGKIAEFGNRRKSEAAFFGNAQDAFDLPWPPSEIRLIC